MDNPVFEGDANDRKATEQPRESLHQSKNAVKILINLGVICASFLLLFSTFQSMQNLQSSINSEEGLGNISLFTIYGVFIFSSIFLPTLVIQKLGVKRVLVLSMLCYSTYIAAQFYPTFYTLCPTGVLLGLAAAPLWSSKCTYISVMGREFASIRSSAVEATVVRFFGVFFLVFQSATVLGNVISSAVLSSNSSSTSTTEYRDRSECGANFCPGNVEDAITSQKPSTAKIYTLATIYLLFSLAGAAIMAIFLDPLEGLSKSYEETKAEKTSDGGWKSSLLATFRQLQDIKQALLVPITFFSGMEQGFIAADYTQAFITCGWGVENIGYVMLSYGICNAICSFAFGAVIKLTGRIPVFIFGALLNLLCIIAMFTWKPSPDDAPIFFILSGMWGMGDAVWQTQINTLHGVLFPDKEASAFSNYKLWESLGFVFVFLVANWICMSAKLWILLIVLLVGMVTYGGLEAIIKKSAQSTSRN